MEKVVGIESVDVIGDYSVRVRFSDGVVREVDLSRHLRGTLGEALQDPEYFALVEVHEQSATLLWPNGVHFHAEELRGDLGSNDRNC